MRYWWVALKDTTSDSVNWCWPNVPYVLRWPGNRYSDLVFSLSCFAILLDSWEWESWSDLCGGSCWNDTLCFPPALWNLDKEDVIYAKRDLHYIAADKRWQHSENTTRFYMETQCLFIIWPNRLLYWKFSFVTRDQIYIESGVVYAVESRISACIHSPFFVIEKRRMYSEDSYCCRVVLHYTSWSMLAYSSRRSLIREEVWILDGGQLPLDTLSKTNEVSS